MIKVEPPGGDRLRSMGAKVDGQSLVWAVVGRNKRSITLDLEPAARPGAAAPAGRARGHRGREPAASARSSAGTAPTPELAARNPRLVVVSLSCFGRSGPYAERAGNGTLAEAFGGLTRMTGERDGPPLLTSLPIGDVLAAIFGALGALAACYQRDARGGAGQRVDVSMYEPILQFLTQRRSAVRAHGPGRAAQRQPHSRRGAAQHLPHARRPLARALRRDRPAGGGAAAHDGPRSRRPRRARFGSVDLRRAHEDELDSRVARWVATRESAPLLEALVKAGIPAAPVNDVAALFADPHVPRARAASRRSRIPKLGPLTLVAPTPRLEGSPARIRSTGPELGAHNDEIYRGELGFGADELAELRARASSEPVYVGRISRLLTNAPLGCIGRADVSSLRRGLEWRA